MEVRANHLAVGALTLLLICSVPALLFWFSKPTGQNLVEHYVRFKDSVARVNVGSSVLFGGIPIGHVTAVRIDPHDSSLARVDVSVDGAVPIYSDSKAALRLEGISGNFLIDISRGGRERSHRLEPGAEIAARYSPFRRLFLDFPEMVRKGDLLIERVSAFVNDHNAALANHILANIAKLRIQFANDASAIKSLRADADNAVAQFNQAWVEFQLARGNIDRLTAVAKAMSEEIRKLASALRGPAANFSDFVEENRRPVEDFWNNGFSQWSPMIAEIHRVGKSLDRLWTEMRRDPARFFFTDRTQQGFEPPPSISEHH
jgi:phospholipid/cholesterol/gamma-HCH transport system substrate-binding protein